MYHINSCTSIIWVLYFSFYILRLTSWIWTNPSIERLKFESPSKWNSYEGLRSWTLVGCDVGNFPPHLNLKVELILFSNTQIFTSHVARPFTATPSTQWPHAVHVVVSQPSDPPQSRLMSRVAPSTRATMDSPPDEECPAGWFYFWMISVHQWWGPCPSAQPGVFCSWRKELCHRNRDSHSVSRPISTTSSSNTRGIKLLLCVRPRTETYGVEIGAVQVKFSLFSIARSNSSTISCKASLLAFLFFVRNLVTFGGFFISLVWNWAMVGLIRFR